MKGGALAEARRILPFGERPDVLADALGVAREQRGLAVGVVRDLGGGEVVVHRDLGVHREVRAAGEVEDEVGADAVPAGLGGEVAVLEEADGLHEGLELDLAPAPAGLAVALEGLSERPGAADHGVHLAGELPRHRLERAVVAGALLLEVAGEPLDVLERLPQGFGGAGEAFPLEFAVRAGSCLQRLEGLAGGPLVRLAGLLVALVGGRAGDGVEVRAGLVPAEALAPAQTGEPEGRGDQGGREHRQEGGRQHGVSMAGRCARTRHPEPGPGDSPTAVSRSLSSGFGTRGRLRRRSAEQGGATVDPAACG